MGAAFAEGMALFLLENGYKVEQIIHINPFQASVINSVGLDYNVIVTDYQNTDDLVINHIPFFSNPGNIIGASYKIREPSQEDNVLYIHTSPIQVQGYNFWMSLSKKQMSNKY